MEDQKHIKCRDGLGRLGLCGPLAVPYVPYQDTDAPKFEAGKALVRGTLFPELELPLHGMVNEHPLRDTPLHELQALAFAIQELALYLDTHREDREALELYQAYQELYERGKTAYQKELRPLSHESCSHDRRYRWLEDPWPWDYVPHCEKGR